MVIDLNKARESKEELKKSKLKIGGKYIYRDASNNEVMVSIVDTDTHVAMVDFNAGTPVKTIKVNPVDKDVNSALLSLENEVAGIFAREVVILGLEAAVKDL